MENPEKHQLPIENQEAIKNPNSIGEVLSFGRDLETSPDKVYRSVGTKAAIDDLFKSGVVRNALSAGVVPESRWGEKVFWSRGQEGKYHMVSRGGFVIEAPHAVALERQVTKEDVTAIYTKNEQNEVRDILNEEKAKEKLAQEATLNEAKDEDTSIQVRLSEVRKELGIE